MSSLKLDRFTGINNVTPLQDQGKKDLHQAVNVDVTNDGRIRRRAGFELLDAGRFTHVFDAGAYVLASDARGQLLARWPDAVHVIHKSLGGRVWCAVLPDGRVAFSNGLQHGLTDGRTATSWGVPMPDFAGTVIQIPGQLPAGKYLWSISHVRADGLESGLLPCTEPVELTRAGGLSFMGMPQEPGLRTRLYLSKANGEQLYAVGDVGEEPLQVTQHDSTVLPRTKDLQAPPAGILLASWNGRALVAVGDTLMASQPTMPEQFDWVRDFKRFEADITLVQPVSGGIYVGTRQALHFLEGNSFDQLLLRTPLRAGVALGSGVAVDGHHIRVGDGNASGECMVCIAGGHIVAGLGGGQLAHLSEKRYRTDCKEVSATFKVHKGMPQYLAQVLA